MGERDALSAQQHFSAGAAINPNQPTLFNALARAAFCAGDLKLARAPWERVAIAQRRKYGRVDSSDLSTQL